MCVPQTRIGIGIRLGLELELDVENFYYFCIIYCEFQLYCELWDFPCRRLSPPPFQVRLQYGTVLQLFSIRIDEKIRDSYLNYSYIYISTIYKYKYIYRSECVTTDSNDLYNLYSWNECIDSNIWIYSHCRIVIVALPSLFAIFSFVFLVRKRGRVKEFGSDRVRRRS